MAVYGSVGAAGAETTFEAPVYLNCYMPEGYYPDGTIVFNEIADGNAYWKNNDLSNPRSVDLYLCDYAGNNRVFLFTISLSKNGTNTTLRSASISGATGLTGKSLYLIATGATNVIQLRRYTSVTIGASVAAHSITVYTATGGTASLDKYSAAPGETVTYTASPGTGYSASAPSSPYVTFTAAGANKWTFVMPSQNVTISPQFSKINYTVTVSKTPSGGGSVSSNKNTANYGDTVTLTVTPNAGWRVKSITTNVSGVAISNNKFTMPASNITVTVTFEKIPYTITKQTSPSGAGTVTTSKSTANVGDSITVSQTPATGYYFNGWETSPANLINNNAFTMPAGNVTVTAKYLKRSTASVDKKSLTSNGTVKLTISPDKSSYSHKYKLSFGTGMETNLTTVNAGTTVVNISVPDSWASQIPNDTQKTGGTLIVETYNGNTKIGTYTLTGFTYNVRSSAVPTLGTITKSIVRTVNGTTYANVGDYYIQNKSAVRIQETAAGVLGSTIAKIELSLSGYSDLYKKTVTNTTSIDFTTPLLIISGTITITIKATDSRGRTATKTTTISVKAYTKPYGTLDVWRVDGSGNPDTMGTKAKYSKTSGFTSVGTNSLTVVLRSQNTNANNPGATGYLLPTSSQTFNETTEYSITLTLTDAFETTVITAKLPTAQFMMYFNPNGDRLAFMKAVNSSLSKNGKDGVIEFSDNAQIYIGSTKLETFITNQFNRRTLQKKVLSNLDENGSDSVSVLTAYPTSPGVYRVGAMIAGLPTGSNGYGPLIIFDGGTYIGHIFIDASHNLYYANGTNAYPPSTWYKLTGTSVASRT